MTSWIHSDDFISGESHNSVNPCPNSLEMLDVRCRISMEFRLVMGNSTTPILWCPRWPPATSGNTRPDNMGLVSKLVSCFSKVQLHDMFWYSNKPVEHLNRDNISKLKKEKLMKEKLMNIMVSIQSQHIVKHVLCNTPPLKHIETTTTDCRISCSPLFSTQTLAIFTIAFFTLCHFFTIRRREEGGNTCEEAPKNYTKTDTFEAK